MDAPLVINAVSLFVALSAVVVSSTLTWRAHSIATKANHFPVIVSLLAPHRHPDFIRKQRHVIANIGSHDPELTLDGLPEPIRTYAFEVSEQYHMLGYVTMNSLADGDLLATQVGHGATRTWEAIEPFVRVERRNRGGEYSFMNSFERFVERARAIDRTIPDEDRQARFHTRKRPGA